jgi:predicted DCC family thiol-disulfide oxidoreductase YuxK
VYFFDGYCVLCSGFVAFCLARDPAGELKFASAQSALGQRVLTALDLPDGTLDRTILLLDGDEVYLRSTAVLRALRHLRGPVRWLQPLLAVPAFVRDPIYDVVARNRYRWFGRRSACFVPTPETRPRFIDL